MRRILASMTCLCLLGAVVPPARAAAEPAEPAAPGADDPALAEAQALYADGLTDYETLDYDQAIDKWKDALGRLREATRDTPQQAANVAAARNAIVYNIARAQEKAFDQDGDVARLKKAKGLLEVYVDELGAAGSPDPDELAKARARIEELGARIDASEQPPEVAPRPQPGPVPPPAKPRGRGLLGGGSALLVVGVGLVAGGVGAGVTMGRRAEQRIPELDQLADEDARRDELARGKRGDTILIACAVSGGVLALAGIAMIAVGATRARTPHRAAVPMVGPGFAGAALHGRF